MLKKLKGHFSFSNLCSINTSMPKAEPAYIRHWAKYHSTLFEISPTGGTTKPATDSATPDASIPIAE